MIQTPSDSSRLIRVGYRATECPDDLSAGSGKFLNDPIDLVRSRGDKPPARRINRIRGNLGRGLFNQSYLARRKSETSCCGSARVQYARRRRWSFEARTVQRLYEIGRRVYYTSGFSRIHHCSGTIRISRARV